MRIAMKNRICRLCQFALSTQPSIKLENIPRGGHVLPKYDQLDADFGVDLEVYQCDNCGLVQIAAESLVYADQVGSAHASSPGMLSHRKRQAYELVERFNLRDKNILEVGCGDGHFMELLADAGAISFGIEPSERATELGRERGLKIQQGYMGKNANIEGTPFDAFVTMHVLEHAPDPNDFLQGVYENLTVDGVGLIEVPSFEQTLENQSSGLPWKKMGLMFWIFNGTGGESILLRQCRNKNKKAWVIYKWALIFSLGKC